MPLQIISADFNVNGGKAGACSRGADARGYTYERIYVQVFLVPQFKTRARKYWGASAKRLAGMLVLINTRDGMN